MIAHVLLNLLNELMKKDKMRGLPSILLLFCNEFNKFNNTGARILDFMRKKINHTFGVKTLGFKRELVDTYAYKLQPSLSERVIVDGYGCHTALHFGVKAKENQDKVPTLYWLPKLHKNPIKQDLLLILVLVRQQNFLKC